MFELPIDVKDSSSLKEEIQSSTLEQKPQLYSEYKLKKLFRKSLVQYDIPLCLISAYLYFPYPVSDLVNSQTSAHIIDEFPYAKFEDQIVTAPKSDKKRESADEPGLEVIDGNENYNCNDNCKNVKYLAIQVPQSVIDAYFSSVMKKLKSIQHKP